MAKGRAHEEEAWTNAKRICRLNARQVEMACALGMNPRKIPGLRPRPQERWKLVAGELIEQRYWKADRGTGPLPDPRWPPTPAGATVQRSSRDARPR
jgi:hypothetical protein